MHAVVSEDDHRIAKQLANRVPDIRGGKQSAHFCLRCAFNHQLSVELFVAYSTTIIVTM